MFNKEVPESIAKGNLHQPFQVVIDYADSIGYRAVCSTNNLFLVRKDFEHLFADVPSDALTLWRDAFRAFPKKQYWIDCRRYSYPDIKRFEGDACEKLLPITLDT